MNRDTEPLARMKNISLRFGHFQALSDVSVDFYPRELVATVGDNGAGKSCLIRILCGIYKPTEGEVYIAGKKVTEFSPKRASDIGIESIHQGIGLCDNLSLARNIFLGKEPVVRRFGISFLDFKKMRDASWDIIRSIGLRDNIGPDDEVEVMSGGERQSVKIGRAVMFEKRIIVMDEPTTALSVRERQHVHDLAVKLRDEGLLVIFISHDIHQVHEIADRIVILENGRKIVDIAQSEMGAKKLEDIIRSGGRVVQPG